MAKGKRDKNVQPPITETDSITMELQPDCEITSAALIDDKCVYSYRILRGRGAGDKVKNHTGSKPVHQDMKDAFKKLNVHLAIIDDAFLYNQIDIDNPEKFHDHELTDNFDVSGFKISGNDENSGVILIGTKRVSIGDVIDCSTPKIGELNSYTWRSDLEESIQLCITEVLLYMNGKAEPQYEQTEIEFPGAGTDGNGNSETEAF